MNNMNKTRALKLVEKLIKATVQGTLIVNGLKKGSWKTASDKELKAAVAIVRELTEEPVTEWEIVSIQTILECRDIIEF